MKYIALDSCRKKGKTDVIHHSMFHGDLDRSGGNSTGHFLGDDLSNPLQISMGGIPIPNVFKPSCSLVVSSAVQSELAGSSNVEFAPIYFRKLVNYIYKPGDFSYYKSKRFLSDPHRYRSDKMLEFLPDDPKLHPAVISHVELVLPNMYRLSKARDDAKKATVTLPDLTVEEVEFVYSPNLLDKYSAFWAMAIFFPRLMFDKLAKHIDWDYFTWALVDL